MIIFTNINIINGNLMDGKDSQMPEITFKGVIDFIQKYFEIAEKYKNRHYKRIQKRQEIGPLKYNKNKKIV